eukprot:gene42192-52406_t
MNRLRRKIEPDPTNPIYLQTVRGVGYRLHGIGDSGKDLAPPVRGLLWRARNAWRRTARAFGERMPKGLYARSLLIVILPMLILQTVVFWVFMERHYQTVTRKLSEAVVSDIAALISVIESYPQDANYDTITDIARRNLNLSITVLPPAPLPPPTDKPFFSLLDSALSEEIARYIGK